jgi:hypothetical protein
VEGWVVNRVAEGQMRELPAAKADVARFMGKSSQCPVDQSPLFGDTSDQVPPEVVAVKCSHCGWWWFPADNLFKFKKAYEAKVSYLKWWKGKREVTMLALPAVLVLLLTVGLVGAVVNLRQKQGAVVTAATVSEFGAQYLGQGTEMIRFKTEKVMDWITFRRLADEVWGPVEVKLGDDGWYEARLDGLAEEQVYQVQIAGKRYYFSTK